MADNTELNPGTGGDVIASDDVGGVKYQIVKLAVGADGAASLVANANPIPISDAGGAITVDGTVTANLAAGTNNIGDVDILSIAAGDNNIGNVDIASIAAGDNNIGNVDVLTVPADPFGANADAASATGSISAKLRFIASTGIPITGTVTVASHAVTNAGTFVTQENGAALTALQLIDNIVATEDAVAGSGYSGVPIFCVRQDSQSDLAADGDFITPTIDDAGGLRVSIVAGAGSGGTAAADDADFTAGTTQGTPAMGIYESTPTNVTDGDLGVVGITQSRALKVAIASGGISGIADDAAFTPGTSEVLPIGFTFDDTSPDSVNEGDIGAGRMSANRCQYVMIRDAAGNERGLNIDASGQPTVAIASAQTLATVTTVGTVTNITNQGQLVDDNAFTAATTRVNMAGFFADETATDSVDEGDGGAARMTLDRKQIVTNYVHAGAGGQLIFRSLDLDETEEEIKATAGKLFWLHVMNLHASSNRFVKFYNATAANVTVGTTTPVLTFPVPPNTDGFTIHFGDCGVQFDTAITAAATGALADNDTTAPGANEVVINLGYI